MKELNFLIQRVFDISGNSIKEDPCEIGHLVNLSLLSGNKIASLPRTCKPKKP
jgi:hypothetical protein